MTMAGTAVDGAGMAVDAVGAVAAFAVTRDGGGGVDVVAGGNVWVCTRCWA
jgi:hypothetical protein